MMVVSSRLDARLSTCARFPTSGRKPKQIVACSSQSSQSQRSVGVQLIQDYHRFQKPAKYNVMFSKALKDFTATAILAYECGYSESLVRDEVGALGNTAPGLDFRECDADDCVLAVALVWITLAMLPQATSKRWATGDAVTPATKERWHGFVRLIVKGYFEKRWAAYPIDRLQTEISLVTGRLERPSTVAEWSRIVFAALENAAPQWPSM